MAEILKGLFTSAPGIGRVNLVGLIVVLLSVLMEILAGRLSRLFPENLRERALVTIKIAGLFVCMAGCVIAIFL